MSTRSTITAKCADGKFRSIYCHFDGYLDGVGATLDEHYRDQAKIDTLMALGDLSSLARECTKPEGHSYANPVDGYCVAYGRDRGEDDTEPGVGDTPEAALKAGCYGAQGYDYLWNGSDWTVNGKPLAAGEDALDA